MHARPPRHIVSLVALLIFLLTGQTGVQGYVWCLGEDGHTALEYAEYVTCGPGDVDADRDCHTGDGLTEHHLGDDHCGPCLDIQTTHDAASRRSQDGEGAPSSITVPVNAGILSATVLQQARTASLLAQPPPRISQAILAHRTTVLRN